MQQADEESYSCSMCSEACSDRMAELGVNLVFLSSDDCFM